MARLAYLFAQASNRVTTDVVEASEFPELARRFEVRGVPKTVLNDEYEIMGAARERDLLDMVQRASSGIVAKGDEADDTNDGDDPDDPDDGDDGPVHHDP
jgi:hypothetical protein